MSGHLFLEDIDHKAILDDYLEHNSRQTKRSLIERGLLHQISFYGAITDRATDKTEARRFEIFSATPYSSRDIYLIKHVLEEMKPPYSYSIWEFDAKRNAIKVIAKYGPRTY